MADENTQSESSGRRETFRISTDELVKKVKELLREGTVRRIIVQDEEGKTLMEIPLSVAVIGTIIAPVLAALGALAGVLTRCTLVIERRDET